MECICTNHIFELALLHPWATGIFIVLVGLGLASLIADWRKRIVVINTILPLKKKKI